MMNAIVVCIGRFWKVQSSRGPLLAGSFHRATGFTGPERCSIHGILRIHGQDHEVTLPTEVSIENGRFIANFAFLDSLCKVGYEKPEHLRSYRKEKGRARNACRGNDSTRIVVIASIPQLSFCHRSLEHRVELPNLRNSR